MRIILFNLYFHLAVRVLAIEIAQRSVDAVDPQFEVTVKVLNSFLRTYFSQPNSPIRGHIAIRTANSLEESAQYHSDIVEEIISQHNDKLCFSFLNKISDTPVDAFTILIADDLNAFR